MRKIVIDTREQRPWVFPDWVPVCVGTLRTGDYALEGDDHFAVERKSLNDFLGTIFSHWQRFQREIGRMDGAGFPAKVIIVEADFADCCFSEKNGAIIPPKHDHVRITPQAVISRIAELAMMNVTVLFCKNEQLAAAMAYGLLMNRLTQIEEPIHDPRKHTENNYINPGN